MVKKQIILEEEKASQLKAVAMRTGKTESELLHEAVERYLDDLESEKKMHDFMSAFGIWKHRRDLPDFKKIRKSLERTFDK